MRSIWSDEKPCILTEKKPLPQSAEVVIIGGGMAGLLCAYLLKESGVQAIVLEAAEICSGQTKNTTAKITSQHGLIYAKLAGIFDSETASRFGRLNERAIDEYERIVRGRGIDCEFKRLPSYLYTKTEQGIKDLERERAEAMKAGIRASIVYETELPFPVKMALKYENQAQFHPLRFLDGIVDGLDVYEQVRVLRVKGNEVLTERGSLKAKHIIFATHFPFPNVPGFYFAKMHQERSYVLGVRLPESGSTGQMEGMYYGIDQDGLSFRSAGDVILVGGKSHRTGVQQLQNPYEALRRETKSFWPEFEETARWSAQDCMTLDSLPYIGVFSKWRPNWYVATGFEKWGMTGSMAAAMVIRDLIVGNANPYASMVAPQRPWTKQAARMLLCEGIHTMKNFLSLQKPRCPHLGCRLKWNRYERTWDCPCHGSRFKEDGTLLDNPAQRDKSK
ncbi:MAG: FAD-dependent oxidoreductase [Lachnoclostridium sp.]|nr:FAD-dependent oxidoreductase [Lachnoclostridium sp.]